MYKLLGKLVARFWLPIILGWIVLAWGIAQVAPNWDDVTNDGDLDYMPDRMTSVRGEQLMSAAFPEQKARAQIAVVLERPGGVLTKGDLAVAARLAEAVPKQIAAVFAEQDLGASPVVDVWTPATEVVGEKLVSEDHRAALVAVLLQSEFMTLSNMQVLDATRQVLEEMRAAEDFPDGLNLGVTGSAAIGGDMLNSAAESIENTHAATIGMVLIILLVVYRAPMLAALPLVTIAISVVVATNLVAILTQINRVPGLEWVEFNVFKTTEIFIITILFGSGTDFCLFLVARYREELQRGLDKAAAVAEALGNVGDALVASAMTTVCGLGMMFFADFGKFRNSGPAIGLCLLVALAACITLAPALLRLFGAIVFWPFGIGPTLHDDEGEQAANLGNREFFAHFWHWAAGVIIRRPGLILVVSVLVMAPLAYEGMSVDISYDLVAELQENRPSVQGTQMVRRHFKPGEIGPVTILAHRSGVDFESSEWRQRIATLTKTLYDIPGVADVRSIAEPLGGRPGVANPFSSAGLKRLAAIRHPRTQATYLTQVPELKGKVTRFDLILEHDPFSREAQDLLGPLEPAPSQPSIDQTLSALSSNPDSPWYGTHFDFVGTTAVTRDLRAVTTSDQTRIQQLVVLAVLAILLILLRRPLICIYLIISVLFTYLVTIGATQWVFGYLYEDFEGLDWKVPIFLFVILVAVGEDYNIYLITRVFEEQRRHGAMEGLRRAIIQTGGIITSCGVIMAGTFVSMMTGTLRAMLELGFALTLGVILDTFVVRPILVPAYLALLYKRFASAERSDPIDEPRVPSSTDSEASASPHAGKVRQSTTAGRRT